MADLEQLNKAITVHTEWKLRLRQALVTRHFDTPAETVRLDDHCALGQWLHGPTLTALDKTTIHYRKVLQLHADFHHVAARVLEHALAGENAEAERMMSFGGEYAGISGELVMALSDWKAATRLAHREMFHEAPPVARRREL